MKFSTFIKKRKMSDEKIYILLNLMAKLLVFQIKIIKIPCHKTPFVTLNVIAQFPVTIYGDYNGKVLGVV